VVQYIERNSQTTKSDTGDQNHHSYKTHT